MFGRALYLSNGYDGIDLTRPSLIGWRPGPAGLVAVIPIKDRKRFLDGFGVAPGGDAPLVRVGDSEGTVKLTQIHGGQHDEYRLLVTNDTAYLARTPEECRQLSLHPLTLAVVDAVRSGVIGELKIIRSSFCFSAKVRAGSACAMWRRCWMVGKLNFCSRRRCCLSTTCSTSSDILSRHGRRR